MNNVPRKNRKGLSTSFPYIQDGACGVRNVDQFCVARNVGTHNGTYVEFWNEDCDEGRGDWTAFATVYTEEEAKVICKQLTRKITRQYKQPVEIIVNLCGNSWIVTARANSLGVQVGYIRKPNRKQLRQLRKAMQWLDMRDFAKTYCIKKGKFV